MQPFIVIRNYRDDDELKCAELVRDYIMSFATKSFYCFCFREITLQFIVITWAIFFIFLGVPILFCALTIPLCVFFLFSGTYFSFYAKAVELMRSIAKVENPCVYSYSSAHCYRKFRSISIGSLIFAIFAQTKPSQSLVAECYEPFIFRCKPSETSYQIFMDDAPFEQAFKNKFRKKIIAAVSVKNHNSVYNAAWIYRFAVAPHYPFQKVAEPMISLVSKNCIANGYGTLECTISEWQENERDFYDNFGFATRQIYHKQIIGSSLTVMKSQLTLDLRTDDALQKQN